MDRKKKTIDLVIEQGILPLYFHHDAEVSVQILKSLYSAGFRAVEYLNRDETAINNFLELRKVADKELHGLQLGAGTIRNKIEATEFINEGANFIICPGVVKDVAALADRNDLLWVPGCLTGTEIILADELGAQLVQLFPAGLLGSSYLTAMKEIFPDLLFMASGDVEASKENLTNWFNSGASAVSLGNSLIHKDWLETKNYPAIESSAKDALQTVQRIKKEMD